MGRFDATPEVRYAPDTPYHFTVDNVPLDAIYRRQKTLSAALEAVESEVAGARGTHSSFGDRISQSLSASGALSLSALNALDHNVAYHADGSRTVSGDDLTAYQGLGYSVSNPVSFVRMLAAERARLATVEDDANHLDIKVEETPTPVIFDSGQVYLRNSPSVEWRVQATNEVYADVTLPPPDHEHFYGATPAHASPGSPNYTDYTTPSALPFIEGSLRVYVNGVRLHATLTVPVPNAAATAWTATHVLEQDAEEGTFSLDRALVASDRVVIDFDRSTA